MSNYLTYFGTMRSILILFTVTFLTIGCNSTGQEVAPRLAVGDTLTLTVLTSTDLHGWVYPWDYSTDTPDDRFGLAKVSTLVDSVRATRDNTMLIDAGDWLQGNQFAAYYASEGLSTPYYPLLKVAEYMKYDAFVLGNHEFNFGIDYLNTRLEQSPSIEYVAGNVYEHNTTNPAYKPFIIKNVGGVQVAIVGLTTPGSAVWDRPRVEGKLDFVDGVEAGRRFVDEARAAGAEIVVVLAHCGLESGSSYNDPNVPDENFGRALLEQVPGIDLFVFGHSHRVTEDTYVTSLDSVDVPVIQAGRWASHLGEANLVITRSDDGSIDILSTKTQAFSVEKVKPSARIMELAKPYHDSTRNFVNKPLTTTSDTWSAENARLVDTPIVDLIHVVQLEVTGAQLSAASAFDVSAKFGPGDITRRDMALIYPYENMLYTIEITGKQLKEYIEQSSRYYTGIENGEPVTDRSIPGYNFDTIAGAEYEVDLRRPIGSRLTKLKYNGAPVQDSDQFTLAVNSYRAEGGGGYGMLAGTTVKWRSEIPVRTYLERHLEKRGNISASGVFQSNWKFIY